MEKKRNNRRLWQITSPYYCAGLITEGATVTEAAPIIRWAKGKAFIDVKEYFEQKKCRVALIQGDRQNGGN